jgi:hypothetical protein
MSMEPNQQNPLFSRLYQPKLKAKADSSRRIRTDFFRKTVKHEFSKAE